MTFDIKISRFDLVELYVTAFLNYGDTCIEVDMSLPALRNILKNGFKGFGHMTNEELSEAWEWFSTGDAESDMAMLSDFVHIASLPQVFEAMKDFWNDETCYNKDGKYLYEKIRMDVY